MDDLRAALAAEISASGWLELLRTLVQTPSHPGLPRQEEAVAKVLASYLAGHGIASDLLEAAPGRPNVLARVEGAARGPRLTLCGHTDTVPLNADDPGAGFSAEIRDGKLWGRGACDMKGALAAMAAALVALRRTGALPRGEVVLAAVVDEEMESLGAEDLVHRGFEAAGAIVGEPTGNRLALGHKGLEWLEIELLGKAAHGGTPQAGINAIAAAARFVVRMEDELVPRLAARVHPLLGPPTVNCGTIRGGDQPSTVAAACRLQLDRRSVPGETYDSMRDELEGLLAAVRREMPGLTTSIRRVPGSMATLEHLPTVLDAGHPLARACAAARAATGGAGEPPTSFPAWTDAALLASFAHIPCAILGPGNLAVAHSPHEHVPLAEVADAALLYALAAVEFCAIA